MASLPWLQEQQSASRARALTQQMEAAAAPAGKWSGCEYGAALSSAPGSGGASVRGLTEVLDVFEEAQVDEACRSRRRAMSIDDIAGMPPH